MTRVALAGSRDLPLDRTAPHIVKRLAGLPDGSTVFLRHPKTKGGHPGGFEQMVAKIASILGRIEVVWVKPDGVGREQVFLRDLDMVTLADYTVAYFPTPAMTGGTGHVVEAAWSKAIPVEAWWIDADGEAVRIGEYDPSADGP